MEMEERLTSGVRCTLGAQEPLNKLESSNRSFSSSCSIGEPRVRPDLTAGVGVVVRLETQETSYILLVAVAAQKDRGAGILCVCFYI